MQQDSTEQAMFLLHLNVKESCYRILLKSVNSWLVHEPSCLTSAFMFLVLFTVFTTAVTYIYLIYRTTTRCNARKAVCTKTSFVITHQIKSRTVTREIANVLAVRRTDYFAITGHQLILFGLGRLVAPSSSVLALNVDSAYVSIGCRLLQLYVCPAAKYPRVVKLTHHNSAQGLSLKLPALATTLRSLVTNTSSRGLLRF